MGYFKDAQEVYDHLGRLMSEVMADPELGPRFRRADTVLRQELTEPEAVITVRLGGGPGEESVELGDSDTLPEVTMSMEADVAHRFWLGEVNVGLALARREMRASGPIDKILRLVPLTRPTFPRYRQQLIDQGREDLVRPLAGA